MFWMGLLFGLFVGVAVGLFTAGLCAMAARRDNRLEHVDRQACYPHAQEVCGESI